MVVGGQGAGDRAVGSKYGISRLCRIFFFFFMGEKYKELGLQIYGAQKYSVYECVHFVLSRWDDMYYLNLNEI